jgi:hypothetical protein
MRNRVESILVVPLLAAMLASCTPPSTVSAPSAVPDFSGLWQVADSDYVRRPDVHAVESDYTPQAWADLQSFRKDWDEEVDDPAKFCSPGGMPHTILTRARDYVMELRQYPKEMIQFIEYMDQSRIVHLVATPVPETAAPANQGFSVGRFEGSVLIIETTNLKARNKVDRLQRSEQARITERWSLRQDAKHGEVIDIDVTVTDPEVFRAPVKGRQMLKRAPPGTVRNEYGCTDALWDDHVARRQAARIAAKP